jgi:hypothetical protein
MYNFFADKLPSNNSFFYNFDEAVEVIMLNISAQTKQIYTSQKILLILELKDEYFDSLSSNHFDEVLDEFPSVINENEMYEFIILNAAINQIQIQKVHLNEIFDAELVYFEKNNNLRDAGEWLN